MNKPFVERIRFDEINLKILTETKQKSGGFTIFKDTFLGKLWNMVKTNWLMLVFCIPIVVWLLLAGIYQGDMDIRIPYSGNIGIGYPIINYAGEMGLLQDFYLALRSAAIMLPLIIIAAIGLAGVFNVVKYLCWGMQVKIIKTFFRGIKNSFAPFMWMGLLLGLCYLLITFTWYLDVYSAHIAVKVVGLISAGLITGFVVMLCVYVFPQAVMFELSIWAMIKHAVLLSTKFIGQSFFITVAGALSMGLLFLNFNSIVQMIAMMVFFFAAFSYTASVWTIFTHYIFDTLYMVRKKNPAAESTAPKQSGTPRQGTEQPVKQDSQQKKQAKPAYHNPKKGKKG